LPSQQGGGPTFALRFIKRLLRCAPNKHKSQEIPTMRYAHPGTEGAIVSFKAKYGNYIGGEFVAPVDGNYFTNTSPVNGKAIAEFPRSTAKDIDKALDAAHAAADAWGKTSAQDRSLVLLKIADRIEQNLELLAITETWDNGKAVRETLNADIPLAADHFRYFAGCIRAQEGSSAEINRSEERRVGKECRSRWAPDQ